MVDNLTQIFVWCDLRTCYSFHLKHLHIHCRKSNAHLSHKKILNISLNLMKGSYFVPCESWTVILYFGKKLDTSMRKYFKGGLKIVNIFAKRKSCHGKFKDGPKTFFYLWSQTRCHPSFEAAKTNLNCHHLSARRDWL